MKRTRRVEVVRYTSRITEIHGESAAVVMTDEQQAGDLILDLLEAIAPPERVNCDGSAPDETVINHPPPRRRFFRLRKLLRLRE